MAESDIRSDESEHLHNWSVDLKEDTVVELLQSEKLQDLSRLGGHLVDTDQSCREQELSFGLDKEVAVLPGLTSESNKISLTSSVLLEVLNSAALKLLSSDYSSLKNKRF